MKLLAVGAICFLLFGCTTEKEFLCDRQIDISKGDFKIESKQCISNGENATLLVQMLNEKTKERRTYIINVVEGTMVFNLTTAEAIAVKSASRAEVASFTAASMSAAALANSQGR